jgi:hypothetical protein
MTKLRVSGCALTRSHEIEWRFGISFSRIGLVQNGLVQNKEI